VAAKVSTNVSTNGSVDAQAKQRGKRGITLAGAEHAEHLAVRRHRALQIHFSERRLLLMVGDLAATALSVFVGLYLWAQRAQQAFTWDFVRPQLHWFILLPALWFVLGSANDYYNLRVSARVRSSLLRLALITAELLVIYLIIFFLSPRGSLPRRFILYYAALSLVLTGVWRAFRLFLIGWTEFRRRVLIVGAGPAAQVIWQALKEEAMADYEVVGCVASVHDLADAAPAAVPAAAATGATAPLASLPAPDAPDAPDALPVLGRGPDLPALVYQRGISELVMACGNEIPSDIFEGVLACYEQGTDLVPMTTLYEQVTGRIPIEHVGEELWALVLPVQGRTVVLGLYLLAKRLLDVTVALVGLALFAPLLLPLALVIKVDSPGPVFYLQSRLGQGGRVFRMWKLRTMCDGAERASGPTWAADHDTRVTRVGKLLRKTRLDEAPQLVNILRGQMSIVGPRPERPEMVEMLAQAIPYYRARLAVKPGLTGWAQVRFRYGSSVGDALRKLQYDLYYIRHQSLALDVTIMVRTLGTLLLLRGK
jgi:lipopolysaccharide/colanic/teichoic acid biosynthesis glycosyltransferase